MDTFNHIIKKIIYLIIGLSFCLNLPALSYGETDIPKLLEIMDKGELKTIAGEAEKALEKNEDDSDSLKKIGIAYHNLAIMEEDDASERASKYLKKLNKLDPDDALILALLGSAVSMEGRDSINIVKKMGNANKGNNMLDQAVNKDPDNVYVRMVRANNSIDIPKFLGRRKFAKIDLLHIEEVINKSPQDVNTAFQAQTYYRLGMIFEEDGDDSSAKSYFKKAVDTSPSSEWSEKAKKKL
jgi:tetratricopeptide (TPR) repeat protein